jgi:hypothetical protein
MTKEEETITVNDTDELVEKDPYLFLITLSHPFVTDLENFEGNAHHIVYQTDNNSRKKQFSVQYFNVCSDVAINSTTALTVNKVLNLSLPLPLPCL